jgi:hypothetical protein
MIMPLLLLSLASVPAAAQAVAVSSAAPAVVISTAEARYEPPQPPAHSQRTLETATDLSRDLAETAAYLEMGLGYFRAFTKVTHNAAENKLFVKFLDDYERELGTAKKEEQVLRAWLEKAAALKD